MRNPLSLESFADWLAQQPAAQEYDPYDVSYCALGQWLRATGFNESVVSRKSGELGDSQSSSMFSAVALYYPYTFGAALARARSALTSAE